MYSQDTIAAISTPPGQGGVGIVRLSGPKAYSIALQLTRLEKLAVRLATYNPVYNRSGELIDNGIVLYFKAPHSFTGEDVVELQIHGSPVILDYLLTECVACGARIARPGEFSERAFLNDKIDLAQAEAIADLIHASSLTAARMAVRSLQGEFSSQINQFNEKLIHLRLYVEAAIDFPDEEIDFLGDGKVAALLTELLSELKNIRANACQGALIREGMSIVIAGRPNAGKSTLINCLAGCEIAIVTDVAGTTRDVMREHILIDDLPVHIIDTAGLRESDDIVEQEGIRRAWKEVAQADCVLMVVDVKQQNGSELLISEIQDKIPSNVPVITVYNKIDEAGLQPAINDNAIYLSAKTGNGISLLTEKIKALVGYQPAEGKFIARRRHLHAIDKATGFLENGEQQLNEYRAGELLAEDLRLAHQALCEITGEFSSDDLLGKIFSSFCIGK